MPQERRTARRPRGPHEPVLPLGTPRYQRPMATATPSTSSRVSVDPRGENTVTAVLGPNASVERLGWTPAMAPGRCMRSFGGERRHGEDAQAAASAPGRHHRKVKFGAGHRIGRRGVFTWHDVYVEEDLARSEQRHERPGRDGRSEADLRSRS